MEKASKIYVAGHRGLVGSAIVANLQTKGYTNVLKRTHSELDLTDQAAVRAFFEAEKPDYVFLAAAKVGGIVANNTYRAEFIHDNLMIQNNVIHAAFQNSVKKLMFLGSTCIYPKQAPQPMREDTLLTDVLEYTNEPYAIAKIAGIKMCESYNLQYGTNYISVMPTNLYGPNDNFDLEKSHVLPALIRKIHLGKAVENDDWDTVRADLDRRPIEGVDGSQDNETILEMLRKYGMLSDPVRIEIWGSGRPMREFLWSEDMADACVYLMERIDFGHLTGETTVFALEDGKTCEALNSKSSEIRNTHVNIGTGIEISIRELAETIKSVIGFEGEFYYNEEKPDGTLRKLTDVSKLNELGWRHRVELEQGIAMLYQWYQENL